MLLGRQRGCLSNASLFLTEILCLGGEGGAAARSSSPWRSRRPRRLMLDGRAAELQGSGWRLLPPRC